MTHPPMQAYAAIRIRRVITPTCPRQTRRRISCFHGHAQPWDRPGVRERGGAPQPSWRFAMYTDAACLLGVEPMTAEQEAAALARYRDV